jgi:hypothetical protein
MMTQDTQDTGLFKKAILFNNILTFFEKKHQNGRTLERGKFSGKKKVVVVDIGVLVI